MEEPIKAVRRLDGLAGPVARHPIGAATPVPARARPVLPVVEQVAPTGELDTVDFGAIHASSLNYSPAEDSATATDTTPETVMAAQAPLKRRWWQSVSRRHIAVTSATVIVMMVGFVGFRAVMASSKVVTKNISGGAPALNGIVDPTKLKGEGDGRINILLLGVGGANHDGGTLSDTIMVASIDPANKTVSMLSIPRDLYVKIPGHGYGRINSADSLGGPELSKTVVSGIIDLPIHYYVQLDFSGFKQAIDAVGGVSVNNETALSDTSYPCDNGRGYCPFVMAPGPHQLNGTTALKYARCRHGSCGNDFGRAARQQQLIVALRQKALEASTLTNPVKVSGLIDSIGDHVRTDFQPNEWQEMASVIKDIDIAKATTKVLDDSPDGLLVEGSTQFPTAGAVLIPKAGAFVYTDIQELAHSLFVDGYLKQENARIEIQNGTGREGLGASIAKQLKAYSYNVTGASTADEPATTSRIIDYTGGKKPYTVQYLQSRFRAEVRQETPPAATDPSQPQPQVVILVGSDYKPL